MSSPSSERHDSRRQHHGSWLVHVIRAPDMVSALFALVVVGFMWWIARPTRTSDVIQTIVTEKSNAVKRAARRGDYDTKSPVVRAEQTVAELRASVAAPVAAKTYPAALTYPGAWLSTTRPGESNVVRFGAPQKLEAVVEPGVIVLTWAPPDSTVGVSKFEIYRLNGNSEISSATNGTPFATTGPDVLMFRDDQIKPGETFTYVVTAVTTDPILVGSGRAKSPNSQPVTTRAVADSKIELVDASEGTAQLRIKKKDGSAWRTRIVAVKEGEAVGDLDPSTGLDWTTQRRVGKISEALSETERTRDEVVFDRLGRVVLDGGIPRRVSTIRRDVWRTVSVTLSGGGAPDETLTLEKR